VFYDYAEAVVKTRKYIMKSLIKEFVIPILLALCVFFMLQAMLFQCVVRQTSMTPTLVEGERIFINKTAYFIDSPKRGDIIVFQLPERQSDIPLIKRVIGLPGEQIAIRDGKVFINGFPLDEPYIKEVPKYRIENLTIGNDRYFVLGDNRNGSYDSHCGWTVEGDLIIGKAWVSIWPLDLLGPAPNYAFADN
jgi:signal peptidase I